MFQMVSGDIFLAGYRVCQSELEPEQGNQRQYRKAAK
jgi:hypothetical protein